MKRNYTTGEATDVQFFTGVEVEHTPAFGKMTLFVTGIQPVEEIQEWIDDFASYEDKSKHIEHIFFGANHSGLCESDNFIPQIRIPIPYIKLWNYNTMLKIDDKNFKATNPGVWSHSLHTLQDRSKFTDWAQYKNDKVIK